MTSVLKKRLNWLYELIDFKGLVYFFIWRYLKVRYKQTALGIIWIGIQPLFLTIIVSLFIFRGLRIDFQLENVAMILPVFFGMITWSYFDKTVNTMAESLRSNRNIMAKVYFPKLIPPISSMFAGLVDFFFGFVIGVILIIATGSHISLLAPLLVVAGILLLIIATTGAGLLFAALTIEYRDISQILPFLFRIGIFVTPVIYPIRFLPEEFHAALFVNPVAGAIELIRYGLFRPEIIDINGVLISLAVSVVLLCVGLTVFIRKQKNMIDVI